MGEKSLTLKSPAAPLSPRGPRLVLRMCEHAKKKLSILVIMKTQGPSSAGKKRSIQASLPRGFICQSSSSLETNKCNSPVGYSKYGVLPFLNVLVLFQFLTGACCSVKHKSGERGLWLCGLVREARGWILELKGVQEGFMRVSCVCVCARNKAVH